MPTVLGDRDMARKHHTPGLVGSRPNILSAIPLRSLTPVMSPVVGPKIRTGLPEFITAVRSQLLSEIEDRRTWHPDGMLRPVAALGRPDVPVSIDTRRASPIVGAQRVSMPAPSRPGRLSFVSPRTVVLCVRRKARKQVLHALGHVGRGSGGSRRRRSQWSNISC